MADITKLHRQLRRLSRRVRQRPEKEARRDNRSVPDPNPDNADNRKEFAINSFEIKHGFNADT